MTISSVPPLRVSSNCHPIPSLTIQPRRPTIPLSATRSHPSHHHLLPTSPAIRPHPSPRHVLPTSSAIRTSPPARRRSTAAGSTNHRN
ncbi:Os07g0438300 [Oryza sativa Japonica Group]|uniref:Os07g0438300 protein n=1 Tax=Oryza sativa subsp. japonica TaxID=39947 RepID=Q0D6U8_ORYSJ|nr:Os07g0438300 [Oryza sativa Japonica Group]|eukprot:NP_001059511.1 Os07g0438300 [Oryza sativa Japonica Group]